MGLPRPANKTPLRSARGGGTGTRRAATSVSGFGGDMPKQRALWASTEVRGGMATYVRVMQQTPLWTDWNIRLVVTHREGSAGAKIILTFARGAMLFIVELIRFRPSVVHLHASTGASFIRKGILLWISQLVGVPVVIHIHDADFPRYCENSPRAVRAVIRATLCRASAVVALGETLTARLQVIAAARMRAIPNPVRPVDRCVQPAPGMPVGVVFLGRIGEHKGTFRLLDAWARLDEKAATLTIAGDGEVERARRRIQELHLENTVEVREWLSHKAVCELLDRAQVLVLPSRSEAQPMAVLEAMARGLCVVAGDVGGLPETIGGCGVLVAPDDIEAIATALRLVIHDHELRARYGAAAYARVADQFDVNSVWPQLDALYREVSR
jgi:glycosyltransferase involved in cell wall biosynthesis